MGRCDQGIKFCSIFKVIRMRRKPCHCIRLVLLIRAVYLLSQTESVWRRYRDLFAKANRQNFWMLTVPIRTVRTVTWQGHTIMMTWQLDDMAHFHWSIVGEYGVDMCHWVANNKRTRGPIQGCHVSHWLSKEFMYKMLEVAGFDPRTSPPHNTLTNSNNQLSRRCSLL
jgi:hypothetical protein